MPSSRARLRDLHTPRKQFGQHFLADPNLLRKIVETASLAVGEVVLEIGPGLGHLTRALSERGAHVVAIELDRDLAAQRQAEFQAQPAVQILEGNFLARSPREWLETAGLNPSSYSVVANIPYYITSAILRHLLEADTPPARIVVLVQREVAQQIVARPPHLNLLAVSIQFYGEPRIAAIVPAGAFYPRPKVDSALVVIQLKPRRAEVDPTRFFKIVRAGFGTRRKQLHNALARGLARSPDAVAQALERAGIEPTRRAETLTLAEWLKLYFLFEHLSKPM